MKNKEIEEKIAFVRGDILTIEAYTDTLLYIHIREFEYKVEKGDDCFE